MADDDGRQCTTSNCSYELSPDMYPIFDVIDSGYVNGGRRGCKFTKEKLDGCGEEP